MLDPFKVSVFCHGFTGHVTEPNVLWLPILIFNSSESITWYSFFEVCSSSVSQREGRETGTQSWDCCWLKWQLLLDTLEVSGGDAELISRQSDDNRRRVYLDPASPPPLLHLSRTGLGRV